MKILAHTYIILLCASAIIIIGSWCISIAWPELGVVSMLSQESLRWLCRNISSILCDEILAWIILLSSSWGALRKSGLITSVRALCNRQKLNFNERLGLQMALVVASILIILFLYLILSSNAPLLGLSGTILPSPAMAVLLPFVSLTISASSVVYGLFANTITSANALLHSLTYGIMRAACIIVVYIMFAFTLSLFLHALGY